MKKPSNQERSQNAVNLKSYTEQWQLWLSRMLLSAGLLASAAMLLVAMPVAAQQDPNEPTGINSGDYNIRQSVEFGYRYTNITGNYGNYDTFVNLGSGVRLFDYTLDMRSLDHNGLFFDNLSFSNFGYGGDPHNVTRLRIEKNKWFNFSGQFRRDKNFWNYNLLANPLNPASSTPALPINFALHGLDLVRRMSDFDLTLLPQSRLTIRLGYSRNINEGPSLATADASVIIGGPEVQTPLSQRWKTTQNSYRFGFDFKGIHRTTLSYDQFLQYFKQDTSWLDQNFPFQLSNGRPVDLGAVFDTVNGTPCSTPVLNAATAPPTAFEGCDALLAYRRVGRPRTSLPTEELGFKTGYFKNLDMTGRIGYSSSDSLTKDFNELNFGNNGRTFQRGSIVLGPANPKRVSVNAGWAATYSVTSKLRIVDSFRYDNFRIPGLWTFSEVAQYAQAPLTPAGTPSMLLDPGKFDATNCPPPFVLNTCPQHNSGSGPDVVNGTAMRFLGQNLKSNTFELEYDFTKRVGGRLGYRYSNRKIADFNAIFFQNETFFPGPGPGSVNAFRGDCPAPGTPGCTLQPDGSVVFSGLQPGSDTARNLTDINAHSGLLGFWTRPVDSLRISFDLEFLSADHSFTNISPRQLQHYKVHATYKPRQWLSLDASFNILEHRNNVFTVKNLEHDRDYSFTGVFSPNDHFSFDLGYTYSDIFSQAFICYSLGFGPPPSGTSPCPFAASPSPLGALSFYDSTNHFAYGDLMWKPLKRITANLGYAGSFVHGNTLFLNPRQPFGPLSYNYQKPYISVAVNLIKGLTYKGAWGYYGYNEKSLANPIGLAPIGGQDFNGNTATFALRYAF